MFTLMTTWRRGREILSARLLDGALPPELFVSSIRARPPVRVPGTAVFMQRASDAVSSALLHSLKHYKALHKNVILLSIVTEEISHVPESDRLEIAPLGEGIWRVTGRYGYMEEVDVPALLERIGDAGPKTPPMDTTYFLGRETLVVTRRPSGMAAWREKIFAWMMRNAESAVRYFHLPPNRVVELGAQIEL
jgi:KUP system potassium uptake protein